MDFLKHCADTIKANRLFFIMYGCFLLTFGSLIFFTSHEKFVLFLNENNNEYFDSFFKYITYVGEGYFYAIFILPLALIRLRFGLISLLSLAISGLFAQIMKHIFEMPRPIEYLKNSPVTLHFVENVDVHRFHSFPSGHTATVFSLAILLALLIPQKKYGILFFVIASAVGLSRMYLLQHFLIDVYVGSFIGIFTTVLIFIIFSRLSNTRFNSLMEKSAYNYFIKKK